MPILCVGETEEERERGDTERKLRHQVQEGLEKVPRRAARRGRRSPTSRSGRSAPARSRRPSRRRRRSRSSARSSRDRDKEAGRARARSSTAARSSPTTPPSCSRCPTSTARSSAAPRWTPESFAAIVEARRAGLSAVGRAVRVPRSCSTAGGSRADGPGNAVSLADTPVFDELWARYPHTTLTAMRRAPSGCPTGQMGNTEVGHLNLGAGAVVARTSTRIDEAVADGSLAENEVLRAAFDGRRARAPDRARLRRRRALLARAPAGADRARRASSACEDVVVHAFTDGRDTLAARAAREYLAERRGAGARRRARRLGHRPLLGDGPRQRWDRTQRAYDLLVHGAGRAPRRQRRGRPCATPTSAARPTSSSQPTIVGDEARIRPGDSVIAFNFRPDRMREITRALAEPGFGEVDRGGAGGRSRATRR